MSVQSARAHPQRVCRAGRLRGWLAGPGGSHRARARRGEISEHGASVADASTVIARTCNVMIHCPPAWNSMCRPRPTQPIFKQLPVWDGRPHVRTYMNDLRRPLMSVWNDAV